MCVDSSKSIFFWCMVAAFSSFHLCRVMSFQLLLNAPNYVEHEIASASPAVLMIVSRSTGGSKNRNSTFPIRASRDLFSSFFLFWKFFKGFHHRKNSTFSPKIGKVGKLSQKLNNFGPSWQR